MRYLVLTCVAAAVLAAAGCAGRQARPAGDRLTVFLSTAEPATLCRVAGLVRTQRQAGPTLWLVMGSAFEPGPVTHLSDGEAAVRLLGAAGVDAVLLTPDWLAFGPARLGQLVDRARCYVLGANLLDSAGRPLGHQFMVKRQNGVELGLAGLWPDSLARALRADGVQRVEPGFAAARTLALMRQRAEVAGAMVGSADSVPAWGFDFLAGAASAGAVGLTLAGEAARYDLRLVDGDILSAVPVRVDLAPAAPDPLAQAVSDSIDRAVEALGGTVVAPRRGRASAEELTQMLVKGHLALKQVDAWLLDGPLFRAGWDGAAITRRDIVTLLLEPQRAMQFELPGAYLRQLSRDRAWTLVLAPGLTAARLSDENTYRVAATSGLVSRHPDLGVTGLAFLPRPLWTIAVDVIESWPDKR